MAKDTVHMKIRVLIKAYLVFNKGKRCTAKEISEWINSGWFGLNRSLVNPNVIGKLISSGRYVSTNMLSELQTEKVGNLRYYWVEA
jgi:hypothetical protein